MEDTGRGYFYERKTTWGLYERQSYIILYLFSYLVTSTKPVEIQTKVIHSNKSLFTDQRSALHMYYNTWQQTLLRVNVSHLS
jgi:hypothetical protein